MHFVLTFLAIIAIVYATSSVEDIMQYEWETFKLEHDKLYETEVEESFRLKIFKENKLIIAKHNQLYAEGKVTYQLGINQFSDMLEHEFNERMNRYNLTLDVMERANFSEYISPAYMNIPSTLDWRLHGCVTEVKNQGQCGSCWAFSTTGVTEGQHCRAKGNLVSLSEQQLLDCSSHNNGACNGGSMVVAYQDIIAVGGIDTEKSYPYKARKESCRFNRNSVGATVRNFQGIPESEQKLMEAVANVGPISVAIVVTNNFGKYSRGVYNEPNCNAQQVNHGVLVVGYGNENGQDYWLVKNSWGPGWGDHGYIKMSRNKQNQCRIASFATFPLI